MSRYSILYPSRQCSSSILNTSEGSIQHQFAEEQKQVTKEIEPELHLSYFYFAKMQFEPISGYDPKKERRKLAWLASTCESDDHTQEPTFNLSSLALSLSFAFSISSNSSCSHAFRCCSFSMSADIIPAQQSDAFTWPWQVDGYTRCQDCHST